MSASPLLAIAGFDIARRLRELSTWVYFVVYAVLAAMWVAASGGAFRSVSIGFGGDKVVVDGPYALAVGLAILGFTAVMVVGSIAGRAVQQDYETGIHHFFFSAPIGKRDYVFGRLLAAFVVLAIVHAGIGLGAWAGTHWPGIDVVRLAADPSWQSYLRPYLWFIGPNVLWTGCIFFVLAALTRQMAPVYVAGVLLLVGYLLSLDLLSDIENKTLAALVDPSGVTALDVVTRYWSVAQRNGEPIPLAGMLLVNRALWLGVGAAVLAFGLWRFPMQAVAQAGRGRRAEAKAERGRPGDDASPALEPASRALVPPARLDRRGLAYLRMLPGLARLYVGEIVRSPRFLTIVLGGVLLVVGNASTLGSVYGTNTYPLTYKVLDVASGLFGIFVLIVTIIYTGELVWRERDARVDEISDSTPAPTWLPLAAKFVAVVALQLALLVVVMACSIGVQLWQGWTRLEIGHYLFDLFVLQESGFVLTAMLAFAIHAAVNHKYLGHFLIGAVFLVLLRLPDFGFEDRLYRYGSRPDVVYSDMNGYGHGLPAVFWFRLYWLAFGALLLLAAYGLLVRGRGLARWRGRGRVFAERMTRPVLAAAGGLAAVFVASGAWIHHNTHVLNPYRSTYAAQQARVDYEKRFKPLAAKPQPKVTSVAMKVDLDPSRHAARLAGRLGFVNRSGQAITDLYVVYPRRAVVHALAFEGGARLVDEAPAQHWHHYALAAPLAPGAAGALVFDLEYAARGFSNDGVDTTVFDNGSFLNAGLSPETALVPSFGYAEDGELSNDGERRKFGLPPRPRMHDLDDASQFGQSALTRDADFVDYRATVCTAADQLPVTSGDVVSDTTQDGRRCIEYRMDTPMAAIYPFVSARYTVRKDVWHGPRGDVAIEIDHQAGHAFNVDRMIQGSKDSLEYFSKNFGPYPHRILRILEFPRFSRRGGFAESFPNTVPFNEAIGFTARVDDKDPKDIDYPYFVTAHEIAHQWWAHQEVPANVQGAEFVTESLAEYSALMVLRQRYGDAKMRRFLKYELDGYLRGRGFDDKGEQPLLRADGAAYVHYQKGALVLYALQDAIGEAAMNDALSAFVARWRFKGPPYARSVDLVAELRRVTPADRQHLIADWIETITLYDLRAVAATARPLGDGRFEVTIDAKARQLRADAAGNETEVPLSGQVDVGVLDARGELLKLLKQPVRSGDNRFVVEVKGEPVRAGIDPLVKWIDRDADDNVVEVKR